MGRTETNVAWRGLAFPSLELCRLSKVKTGWRVGSVSHLDPGGQTLITYRVSLNRRWETEVVRLRLIGPEGGRRRTLEGDDEGRGWSVDSTDEDPGLRADLAGVVDVDLEFSPSTNILPIRRLNLSVGESAPVRAAWVDFPNLTVKPIEQTYTRLGERTYRYESGTFQVDLDVDEDGLVIDYPAIWQRTAPSDRLRPP